MFHDREPSPASSALCFKLLLTSLLQASEKSVSEFPSLRYPSFSGFHPQICLAKETQLIAMLPSVYLSGLPEHKTHRSRQVGGTRFEADIWIIYLQNLKEGCTK